MAIFLIIPQLVHSQETRTSDAIISIAEELASDDSGSESEAYIEKLYELSEDPVLLNSASEKEISRLFFLSDFQVKALADYVHSSGRIVSVYELMNIPGFDKETTEMIIPFLSLEVYRGTKPDTTNSTRLRSTSLTNFSFKSPSDTTKFLGSQWKILSKYKFTAGNISGGVTVEKDPGEAFISGYPPQPDFVSANLAYKGHGIVRRLVVGDFSARFGQGTNINTGIRTGLSLTSPGYMSASDEIKPYTSTDENNFFRGVAGDLSLKNLELFMYYSNHNSDASLGSLSDSNKEIIESFYSTGLHNTSSSLQKKDAYSEIVYGVTTSYNFKVVRIGFAWSGDRLSLPVVPPANDPEKLHAFKGYRKDQFSGYYSCMIKKILIYGELTGTENNQYAFVNGLSFRPSDRMTINALYRNYDQGYSAPHGRGPGIRSATGNEEGVLANVIFEAAKHLFISAGADVHYFPWLKYRCSSPSSGRKQEVRIRYLPAEKLTTEIVYQYRLAVYDESESSGIPEQRQLVTNNIKGSVRYDFSGNLTMATRIDFKLVDPSESTGVLLSQDVIYKLRQVPVTLWFRYCLFHTDDWDSRLYAYENDLLYSFSIPALSGKGSRCYIMGKWEISDNVEMRVKYGITSLIEHNTSVNREEIKFQVKIFF